MLYSFRTHLLDERHTLGLFHQSLIPAELYHGLEYAHRLPHRVALRTATEAERHAECGVEHDLPAHRLVMLAGLVASFTEHDGVLFWVLFAAKFAAYCCVMIFLIPRLTRWFLRRYSDAVMQFIFVMAMLFMSAALSQTVGIEGVFGAFFAGLILNRYIPHVSPLMNRLEFIGNALFIPYFLIGVGMLINVGLLFQGGHILWVVLCIVFFGTLGKAIAAYAACSCLRVT